MTARVSVTVGVCVRIRVPGVLRDMQLPTVQQQDTGQCGGGIWLERPAGPSATHGHFPEPHSALGILGSHDGPDVPEAQRWCRLLGDGLGTESRWAVVGVRLYLQCGGKVI